MQHGRSCCLKTALLATNALFSTINCSIDSFESISTRCYYKIIVVLNFFEVSNLSSLSSDSIVRWSLDVSERRNYVYILSSRTCSEIEVLFLIWLRKEIFEEEYELARLTIQERLRSRGDTKISTLNLGMLLLEMLLKRKLN